MAEMEDYRDSRIAALYDLATGLVQVPDLKQGGRLAAVLVRESQDLADLVKAVSSSNPGYAEKDLPTEVRNQLVTIRHSVRILTLLYGPRAK